MSNITNIKKDALDRLIKDAYIDMFENESDLSFGSLVMPPKEVFLKGALDKIKAESERNRRKIVLKINKILVRVAAAVFVFALCLGIFFTINSVDAFKLKFLNRIFDAVSGIERSKDLVKYDKKEDTDIESKKIVEEVYEKLGLKKEEFPFIPYLPTYLPKGFSVKSAKLVKYAGNRYIFSVNYYAKGIYVKYTQRYDRDAKFNNIVSEMQKYKRIEIMGDVYYIYTNNKNTQVCWQIKKNTFKLITNLEEKEIKKVLINIK